jgi:hypothetical protein
MATIAKRQGQQTVLVPVTTREEVDIPSDAERAELIASLRAAEARIAAGRFIDHQKETFVDRWSEARARVLREKA